MTRTYLITASSGIGAETARILARMAVRDAASINVFFCGHDERKCADLRAELTSLGASAAYAAGDLTDPAFPGELTRRCREEFGAIDALFNVAGISGRRFGDGPIQECTDQGWEITLQTNITTQFRVSREALRIMLEQPLASNGQRGVILNMASVLGLDPAPPHFDTIAYAASKGAILAMTRTMAASCAHHKIRVNAIAPGLVRTLMSARASENAEILAFMRVKQPLVEDVISVEDAASSCVFLLTDASHAITGQTLTVDAGWTLA